MTDEKPQGEAAAEELARVDKLLHTAQQQAVRAKSYAKDMARIKRVNGIANALNQRWPRAS